jgi:hypothetical protein
MSKEIEIVINEDATIEMEAKNYKGQGCHEALENYQKVVGKALKSKKKAEFYQGKVSINQKAKG